jgi:hypothetical protein
MMNFKFVALLFGLILLSFGGLASAQEDPIAWSSLNEDQQQVLRPYA